MHPFIHSTATPDKPAVIVGDATLTYAELDTFSRRLAAALFATGIARGDTIAIMTPNCTSFFVIAWAAQRSGLYYVPLGYHLRASEIAYVLADSGAKAFFVADKFAMQALEALAALKEKAPALLVGVGSRLADMPCFGEMIATQRQPLSGDVEGGDLLYTSGTTGRPKGVKRALDFAPLGSDVRRVTRLRELFEMDQDTVFYTPAPVYHAAPLRFAMTVLRLGGTLVLTERFDPETALHVLVDHRVTHSQWVPTMFVRLLRLSDEQRAAYHAPAHRKAIHSGAPCSAQVKRGMIDWWGPILHEYYSGTESVGFTHVTSQEWLRHPGTVGRPWGCQIHVLGEDDIELAPGEIGNIYFEGKSGLSYHNDAEKTRQAHSRQGWATMGDIGHVNEDGYLFLSDRKNFVIVSGGVNIYPKEIEETIEANPDVFEAAVFGLPDPEYGEIVQAVVQLHEDCEASPDLAAALFAAVKAKLASYKCPKYLAFEKDFPRLPNGKLQKHVLRDRYKLGGDRGYCSIPRIEGKAHVASR